MKIQKLIFENINSLYGKWTIDFLHPVFADGIFAITGNTGSGKTTILDAVCLALYGETPRMEKERCEAISKGRNSLSSELTFEIETGPDHGQYIAFFSASLQKNGKPSAKMPHLLSKDGIIIAEKTSNVKKKINEITGLNMSQFMQTVLLAQGAFDAFLKAGNDKAAILEEITGTEIYSKISMEVFRCAKEHSDHLDLMQAELNGILLLPQEVLENKQKRISDLQQRNEKLNIDLNRINQLLKYKEQLEIRQNELDSNQKDFEIWTSMQKDFYMDDQRLEMHRHTMPITPFYRKWIELEQTRNRDTEQLAQYQNQLPDLKKLFERSRQNAESSASQYRGLSEYISSREPLWAQVESLDAEINPLNEGLVKSREKMEETDQKLQALSTEKISMEASLKEIADDLISHQKYSELHAQDALLPEYKAKWIEYCKNLFQYTEQKKKVSQKIKSEEKWISELNKDIQELIQVCDSTENEWKNAAASEKQYSQMLQDSLGNDSFESLEKLRREQVDNVILRRKILDLSELRAQLINGKECPLCGSLDHPYRKDMPAEPELTEAEKRLNETEGKLRSCRKLEADLQNASKITLQLHSKLEKQQNEITFLQAQLQKAKENLTSERMDSQQCMNAEKELRSALEKELFGFNIPYSGENTLPDAVDIRIKKYSQCIHNTDECKNKKQQIENELGKLLVQMEEIQQNLNQLQLEYSKQTEKLQQKKDQRSHLFIGAPAMERADARAKFFAIQQQQLHDEKKLSESAANLKNTEQQISILSGHLTEKAPELQNAYASFQKSCEENGMSQTTYLAACLSEEEAMKLAQQKTAIAEQKKKLDEQKKELIEKIADIKKQIPEQCDFEQLAEDCEQMKTELLENASECGALRNELMRNEENQKLCAGKLAALEDERRKGETLSELNSLIGSAAGEKFCRIAQGITLDRLLELANIELKKMLSRYELIRKAADSLDIDVIDDQQGSIIRTTSNLSGGERFLVSLALALGLSSMAGEKIRIQTLFLDEGFGSLDSSTREFALQTLANLQKTEDKMIGIISHVPEVREKINCLIEVTPIGSGMSVLSGPGITHS